MRYAFVNYELMLEVILQRELPGFDSMRSNASTALQEIGLDSLAAVRILVAIEDELGMPLPEDEIDSSIFDSPANLLRFVLRVSAGG